jgi:hypothetical protein
VTNRCLWLWIALLLFVSPAAAGETPKISIELAQNSANEQLAKSQLERLLKERDMSRWIFTKKIRIEQGVRPRSHPVLTLNTRHVTNDRLALASFVHEQIHWFLSKKSGDVRKAIAAMRSTYPDAPESLAIGGAGTSESTYLHLIVCHLEYVSMRTLVGADAAAAAMRESIALGQTGLGYHWIYQKVLDDHDKLSGLVQRHKLKLPGV